jgi:hypothetical protein
LLFNNLNNSYLIFNFNGTMWYQNDDNWILLLNRDITTCVAAQDEAKEEPSLSEPFRIYTDRSQYGRPIIKIGGPTGQWYMVLNRPYRPGLLDISKPQISS